MNNMPINENAERALLGALINEPILIDETNVTKEDFYYEQNQEIFECIVDMKRKGVHVDIVTISEAQGSKFDIAYINNITTLGIITSSFKHWEKIVIEKSVCRKQIDIAHKIIEKATVSEDASSLFMQDFNSYVDGELESFSDILVDTVQHIEDYLDRKIDDGIPSNIRALDYFISGFRPGDIYYLGARPSIGKTAFALQIIKKLAEHDNKIAFFSLEMGKKELAKRMIVNQSNIHLNLIKERKIESDGRARINNAASQMFKHNISISDKGGQTVESILTKARRHKKKHGLDILFIDHFHILETQTRGLSANEKATHNSRMLKYMAKELEIPVVCLVQLNRKLEERPKNNRMPILSDIRDSGSLEQDADVIIFINREDYWYKDDRDYNPTNIADIKIAKNRNGETGKFGMLFHGGTQRFDNI